LRLIFLEIEEIFAECREEEARRWGKVCTLSKLNVEEDPPLLGSPSVVKKAQGVTSRAVKVGVRGKEVQSGPKAKERRLLNWSPRLSAGRAG